MSEINVFVLDGRIGKVEDLRDAGTTKVLKFSLAHSYYAGKGKGEDNGDYATTWYNVDVFGKQAESLSTRVSKGARVIVTGRFAARPYTRKDSTQAISLDITASDVSILDKVEAKAPVAAAAVSDEAIPF